MYEEVLRLLDLRESAAADMKRRGLTAQQADTLGIRSVPRKGAEHSRFMQSMESRFGVAALRACPGFIDKNGRLTFWSAVGERDGFVFPYRDEGGRITGLQLKVLGGKYLNAVGTRIADMYHLAGVGGPGDDLFTTEGGLKAAVANTLGNVWCFGVPGQSLAPEQIAVVRRLRPGRVIVALDQEPNLNTARAKERWLRDLHKAGLPTHVAVWEGVL